MNYRNKILTVLILAIIFMLGTPPLTPAADFGPAGLRWGLSPDEVKDLELHKLSDEQHLLLVYRYTPDYNADGMFVTYDFDTDGLYRFSEVRGYEKTDWEAFLEACPQIKAHLDSIFGPPVAEEAIWSAHTPADFDRDNLIGGLAAGYLRFHMYWENAETEVKLMLVPQSYGQEGILIMKEYTRK